MKIIDQINEFINKNKLWALREVALFMIVTLVVHYSYRYWAGPLQFKPVTGLMNNLRDGMADLMYNETTWILDNFTSLDYTRDDEGRVMYFEDNKFVGVNKSCSGFKQILQFILLFLIYPGPWKKKLWFIPLGVFVVHLVNLVRITGLVLVILKWPDQWQFAHDYFFRFLFYAVIFALWVWWVEKIYPDRMKGLKAGTKK